MQPGTICKWTRVAAWESHFAYMDIYIGISRNFHMSKTTFFLIFFNHLKMSKPFLAHTCTKPGHSLPTPGPMSKWFYGVYDKKEQSLACTHPMTHSPESPTFYLFSCFFWHLPPVLLKNCLECYFFFLFLNFIYLFLERGRKGRGRGREKHLWIACPQPRHVPWLGPESATLPFAGQCPIHWATPAWAECYFFIYKYFRNYQMTSHYKGQWCSSFSPCPHPPSMIYNDLG